MLVGLFFYILWIINRTLLNCMSYQSGPMLVSLIATLFHFPICYLLTYPIGLGIYGPAVAFSMNGLINFLSLHIYTTFLKDE